MQQSPEDSLVVGPEHYRVYLSDGTASNLEAIRTALSTADVILVGESHDDPVAVWMRLSVKALASSLDGPFSLGGHIYDASYIPSFMFKKQV